MAEGRDGAAGAVRRPGRPRDECREGQIRRAALEVLAEVGFDRLTMDAVAERAGAGKATLYRRWPSKGHLVVDVLGHLGVGLGPPGDARSGPGASGSDLRGDLRVVLAVAFGGDDPVRQRVVVGLASALCRHPDLDLDLLGAVGPALLYHRLVVTGEPVDPAFVDRVVDRVLLPLATAAPTV